MEKLKAFFNNTIVKVVAWIVIALASIVLILGGAGVADISGAVELVGGVITAVSALIIFISNMIHKK